MNEHWSTHLFAVLPHPSLPALLAVQTPTGLSLPSAILDGQIDMDQIDRVQPALGLACELPVHVLRSLATVAQPEEQRQEVLFLLELHAGMPDSHVDARPWAPLADASRFALLPAGLRAGLDKWLAERDNPTALQCADWAQPGWYAQAEAWIQTQVAGLGHTLLAIEPVKSWAISAVLRVRTEAERSFYFKTSRALPLFVNEGLVMAELARLYPANIPMPLAVDAARGWLLLADFGQPLGRDATLDQQIHMFQSMARLQRESSGQIETLLRAGCLHRPIAWLQTRLEGLLADEISLSQLTPAERAALAHGLPRLRALLDELDALPIPPALLHGDLHTGNVALVNGHIQIFDWTDAAISHPFFDVFEIFTAEDPLHRQQLAAAYTAIWAEAYPPAAVQRAMQVARIVYGLYHAVSYSVIVNNLGPDEREDLNSACYFLRQVLEGLAQEA